jgi:cytochrome d ubiquinol oxidase subunit I
MRTKDAVTEASGVWVSFSAILVLYTLLGVGTVIVLRAMARRWRSAEIGEHEVPYGPQAPPPAPAQRPGGS